MIIVVWMAVILSGMAGVVCIMLLKEIDRKNRTIDSQQHLIFVLNKWDERNREKENFLANKLKSNGYHKIAVYGCSIVGRRIAQELKESVIELQYYIDRNAANIPSELPVYSGEELLPEADVIVVTVVSQFFEIRESLKEKVKCPVIAFEDLL